MKKVLILIILNFLCKLSIAQFSDDKLKLFAVNIDSFYKLNPLEKAYTQINKDWYLPGETIFFKTYVSVDYQLSELSKVVYVDLLDSRDSVIAKTMWKLDKNVCKGDILIPSNLQSGNIKLRTYTMWMLNTPEAIDQKMINIVLPDALLKSTDNSTNNNDEYRVFLFPEGGDLINGLKARLAFKITDKYGLPVQKANVELQDGTGKLIASTNPFFDGMGSFEFVPDIQQAYKLSVKIDAVKYVPKFPPILENGISFQVSNLNENRVFYTINRKESIDNVVPEVWVVAHMNGQIFYAEKIKLEELVTGGAIAKKNLPHGVMNITVFNNNQMPLLERLVFIKKVTEIVPNVQILTRSNQSKGKNSIRVETEDDKMQLSISVATSEGPESRFNNNTISSYFLLNSEVKGYVHHPAYYFENNDSSHKAALDLLMQTQGWRRFESSAVLSNKQPTLNYFIETGISIRGLVQENKNKNGLQTEAQIDLIVKSEDSTTIVIQTPILKGGSFIANNLDFRKSGTLYMQGKKLNVIKNQLQFDLLPNYIDTLQFSRFKKVSLLNFSDKLNNQLYKSYSLPIPYNTSNLTLGNVTVNSKVKTKEQRLTDEYVSDWYKSSDFSFAIDSLTGFSSIWQYLQGQVPGLNISGDMFNPTVNFSRYSGGITDPSLLSETFYESLNTINGEIKSSIAFFLNEMPVSIDNINSINPKDIALVKVNRGVNAVSNSTAGSMFIYTRKGSVDNSKGFAKQNIRGYNYAKEYFNPKYETDQSKLVVDKRSSIYWNPDLKFKNKAAVLDFYNNDAVGKYTIVIEGLDAKGIPVYFKKIID